MNTPTTQMMEKWNNRALFRLLWPLVIEQFLAVTMGVADTAMISSVGEVAVSGVNIIDNINNLLIIAFIALCTGGSVVVSQYIGRQDHKNSALASRQLIYIVCMVSVLITSVALLFRRPIISVFYGRIEEDVMKAAQIYFLITALSYPFLAIYNACAALFRSVGNSKVPMGIAILVNVINIVGNYYFIHGLHLSVVGVGLATLLSRIAAAAVLLVMLIKNRRSPVSLSGLLKVKLVPDMIRRVLNIGIPTGLETSMFQFGRLLTQRIFPYFGTSIMAANAVAGVVNSFGFMTGNAFCMALLTVVGQCIGAGDYEAAKKYTVKIIKVTWITVATIACLILFCRKPLTDLFSLSPEARSAATTFLVIHSISMIIGWTISFAVPSALRAAGDAKYIMVVGIITMWVVRVSFAYILSFGLKLGPLGVWFAMGCDFLARGACFVTRWRRGKWQKMKVIDPKS